MTNKNFFITAFIVYIIYIFSALFDSDALGNILSPVITFIAFLILFKIFLINNKRKYERLVWLSYSLACLIWAIADTIWAIYAFVPGLDPENSQLIVSLYPITNLFLTAAMLLYGIRVFKKWNMIQLIIDATAIGLCSFLFLWIVFLNKSAVMFEVIIQEGLGSTISIVLNVIILIGIAIWYISIRKGKVPMYLIIMSAGISSFVITDIYYYYVYFKGLYIPNTAIDVVYMAAFLLLAFGGLASQIDEFKQLTPGKENCSNVGFKRRGIILLIAPTLVIMAEGIVLYDLINFLVIILLHEVLSVYVQASINSEMLLKKEVEMNRRLEDIINSRTKEIVEKSEELERKNKELDFLSNQDTLTSLYNRRYFTKSLKEEIQTIKPGETIAILYIDVDRFKIINDTYGHPIGDQLLIELSERLKQFNRDNSILARLGGDEFVLGLHGSFEYKDMEQMAADIIKKCSEKIEIGHYIFHVGLSIGISIYPLDAHCDNTLMKNADIAMYQAKAAGRGRYISFNSAFTDLINRKNHIELLLRKANLDKEFEVFYQPQFGIPDKRLIGAEALLRWNKSSEGFISPAEFIPVAEEIDYINSIGQWVMHQAINKASSWNNLYSMDLKIGINVSPKQLDNKDFINKLKKEMKDNNILAQWIDIEITESIAIEGEYRIAQIESIFKGVGVSISVDDFGTGYSSLSYLKFLPFERIKIAKPLIDAIATDHYDLQIVKAIIMLAKSINLKTIAEGVETQEQLDILIELGCDEIQGYLLGRPVPADVFEQTYLALETNK